MSGRTEVVLAEIIRDSSGRLINLKPLNPGEIKIITNDVGQIKRYEQTTNIEAGKTINKWQPENIFHILFNRIASSVHGFSEIIPIEETIKMLKEAKLDMKKVFHRYVKPLLITQVDTDDATEIAAFKAKLDAAMQKGENMIIPKDVANVDRVSIPQFSTLDPIPWIRNLTRETVVGQGVPQVVLGSSSEEDTEASSKIVYLAFEQSIKFRQMVWEENIRKQLNMDIKLEFMRIN